MKVWNKLSIHAKYYIVSFFIVGICWMILSLLQVEFVNITFFLTAFIWHFALLTPGLKEKVMTNHHKLSFLAIVVRMNHYLQIFINVKRFPHSPSFIRGLSPAIFTFLLFVLGGNGNILFTILGSVCFEASYLMIIKKTGDFSSNPLVRRDDQDTPPVIPSAGKTLE